MTEEEARTAIRNDVTTSFLVSHGRLKAPKKGDLPQIANLAGVPLERVDVNRVASTINALKQSPLLRGELTSVVHYIGSANTIGTWNRDTALGRIIGDAVEITLSAAECDVKAGKFPRGLYMPGGAKDNHEPVLSYGLLVGLLRKMGLAKRGLGRDEAVELLEAQIKCNVKATKSEPGEESLKELKELCREAGLLVSGTKAVLRKRWDDHHGKIAQIGEEEKKQQAVA